MQKRLECIVFGRVQGVSYRDFVRDTARGLLLTGTVQNLPDGTVGVVAEGEEANLKRLTTALKEQYPFAKVDKVEVSWGTPTGSFSDFRIVHS